MPGNIPHQPLIKREFPLSLAQERLWFVQEWYPDMRAYHIHTAWQLQRIDTNIDSTQPVCDVAALQYALQQLIQRHAVLRTIFRKINDLPVQNILWTMPVPLKVVTLAALPATEQAEKARQVAHQIIQQPFDLIQGPLWRVCLIQQNIHQALLVVVFHHLIADGWSLAVFWKEFLMSYQAALQKKPVYWEALPIQYADFAVWQREFLDSEQGKSGMAYWREQLVGELPLLELPYDYPRPNQLTFAGGIETLRLDEMDSEKIRQFCRTKNVTLFMFLLASFQLWLRRYSGENDTILGVPFAERMHPQTQGLIGLFVNTLVIRQRIQGNPSFLEFLDQVKQTSLQAYQHAEIPLELLVKEFAKERLLNRTPLFQILFAVQNFAGESTPVGTQIAEKGNGDSITPPIANLAIFNNMTITPVPLSSKTAKFDLSLFVEPAFNKIILSMEYNSSLFKPETVQQFLQSYQFLLTQILHDPLLAISELPVILPAQEKHILQDWNNTQDAQPAMCLPDFLSPAFAQYPEQMAIQFPPYCMTYHELHTQTNHIAHYLLQHEKPGNIIPIILERGPQMILAVLAVIKAGMAYVPLDANLPHSRLLLLLQSLSASCVITDSQQLSVVQELKSKLPWLHHTLIMPHPTEFAAILKANLVYPFVLTSLTKDAMPNQPNAIAKSDVLPSYTDSVSSQSGSVIPPSLTLHTLQDWQKCPTTPPDIQISPSALAYIIFTSGSTGIPKGVMVNHRTAVNVLRWVNQTFHVVPGDQLLWVTSLGFDLSVYDIFGILAAGGTIRCTSQADLQDPAELASILTREPITFWDSAPVALQQVLLFAKAAPQSKLRLVFLSGDWIPVSMPDQIRELFPSAEVISLGGATEATVWSNYYPIKKVESTWSSIPYGKPITNARYYILDHDWQPCPLGVPGDLYIGGDCLALGYFNEPVLTAKKFMPDPFVSVAGARMYATGDRAKFWQDGTMEFLGRLDQQVKIRGFRIELAEVNTALSQHPAIQDVAVIAEGQRTEKMLIAYFVLKSGMAAPKTSDLRKFLQERLPHYMIPSYFVALAQLPVTDNGKLNRRALPSLLASPGRSSSLPTTTETAVHQPTDHLQVQNANNSSQSGAISRESQSSDIPDEIDRTSYPTREAGLVAPRTPWEELIYNVWQKFLPNPKMSILDNFFEIGGHSLLAMQMVAHLRRALGYELTVQQIFETPSIAQLAAALDKKVKTWTDLPPEITPIDSTMPQPLSYYQERFWLLSQLHPESFAYHIPVAFQIQGNLQVGALKVALDHILQRQTALRCKIVLPTANLPLGQQKLSPTYPFSSANKPSLLPATSESQFPEPQQLIMPHTPALLEIIHLQNYPIVNQSKEIHRLMTEFFQRPFHFEQDVLLRAMLLILQPQQFLLLLVTHHIACDGSLPLLVQELAKYYHEAMMSRASYSSLSSPTTEPATNGNTSANSYAAVPSITSSSPHLPLQYLDFAAWQRKFLQGKVREQQLAYWKKQLSNAPTLQLPIDFPRPNMFQHHGANLSLQLPLALTSQLHTLAGETGSTMLMIMLSGFALVLNHASRQNDLVIGTPIQDRPLGMEEVIGSYVNTLALRLEVSPHYNSRQWIAAVRNQVIHAYMHKDIPFEMVIEEVGVGRDLSRTPLFQAMLAWQPQPISSFAFSDLSVQPYPYEPQRARFDLLLGTWEQNGQIHCVLEYNRDIFANTTILKILQLFQVAMEWLCQSSHQKVAEMNWPSQLAFSGSSKLEAPMSRHRSSSTASHLVPPAAKYHPLASVPTSKSSSPPAPIPPPLPPAAPGQEAPTPIPLLPLDAQSALDSIEMITPRDWLEWKVSLLWQRILQIKNIGIKQHFLDLGGHSLAMARLLLQARQEFQQDIRLADFLENSTIEGMANLLRQKSSFVFEMVIPIHTPQSIPISSHTNMPPNSTMPVTPRNLPISVVSRYLNNAAAWPGTSQSTPPSSSTLRPTILAIPPAGGHSFCYLELARLLPDYPFYLFQAPGLDPQQPLDYTIPELAARYIAEAKRLAIPGPYWLIGWSFGGVVAYEMAQQWKVDRIILFDSPAPKAMLANALSATQRLIRLARNFQVEISENELTNTPEAQQLQKILDQAQQKETLPLGISLDQAYRWLAVFQHHEQILLQYAPAQPLPYQGNVLLIYAAPSQANELISAWQSYVSNLKVKPISCSHFALLQKPYVQQIVEWMK